MKNVFISYHTESAKALVENIAERLESRGVSCWFAPRDCENMWAEAIVQAIDTAEVFLVLLNTQSCTSENVKNEIHIAHENYCHHKLRIVAFQIEEQCLSFPSIRYYLGRSHVLNGSIPPLEDRLAELVNRIIYIKNNELSETCPQTHFVPSQVTPVVNFVGRNRELVTLGNLLDTYKKVFLSGMGGIGKSELVKQFAYENQSRYSCVLWGQYKHSLQELFCDDDFVKIPSIYRDPPEESDDSYCRRKLDYITKHGQFDTLLIIDNFDCEDDPDLEKVLHLPISIIFTTRSFLYDSDRCYLQLEAMDNMDDLLALFKKGYPILLSPEDTQTVIQIIEALGRHTLAIKLVANHMRQCRIRPAKMLAAIHDSSDFGSDTAQKIGALFELSSLSPAEQSILVNLALIPPEGIGAEDFAEAIGIEDYDAINDLIGKNWILYDSARDYLSLHPLICQTVMEKLGYSDDICENYVQFLTKTANHSKYIESGQRGTVCKRILRLLQLLPEQSAYYTSFYLACAKLFHAFSMHHQTISYMQTIMDGDHTLYARVEAATDIADAYRCMNDNENLLRCAMQAEALCAGFSPDDPRARRLIAELNGRFGWYHYNRSEFSEALERFDCQLQDVLIYETDDDERIGWGYFNTAIAKIGLDRNDEAVADLENAQSRFRNIHMDFALAVVARQIAQIHTKTGNLADAQTSLEYALEAFTRVVGDQHNDVAVTRHQLAQVCHALGNEKKARQLETLAYEYCKASGYEHIITDWLF